MQQELWAHTHTYVPPIFHPSRTIRRPNLPSRALRLATRVAGRRSILGIGRQPCPRQRQSSAKGDWIGRLVGTGAHGSCFDGLAQAQQIHASSSETSRRWDQVLHHQTCSLPTSHPNRRASNRACSEPGNRHRRLNRRGCQCEGEQALGAILGPSLGPRGQGRARSARLGRRGAFIAVSLNNVRSTDETAATSCIYTHAQPTIVCNLM